MWEVGEDTAGEAARLCARHHQLLLLRILRVELQRAPAKSIEAVKGTANVRARAQRFASHLEPRLRLS